MDILVLDDVDRMNFIGPKGKYRWTSSDHFGGSDNSYDTHKKRDINARPSDYYPWRVYIPPRIVVKDYDGDGINEALVIKNYNSMRIIDRAKVFEKGQICELVWEESTFVTNWRTQELEGYITDFQVKDVDHDGKEDLVAAHINPASIIALKDTSSIIFFRLD